MAPSKMTFGIVKFVYARGCNGPKIIALVLQEDFRELDAALKAQHEDERTEALRDLRGHRPPQPKPENLFPLAFYSQGGYGQISSSSKRVHQVALHEVDEITFFDTFETESAEQ